MNSIKKIFYLNIMFIFFLCLSHNTIDVTIVGHLGFAGLDSLPTVILDEFKDILNMNIISTRKQDISGLSLNIQNVLSRKNKDIAPLALFFEPLWYTFFNPTESLPASPIKIAFSMLESSKIPKEWVFILNEKFDAVCVPDDFLISVYKNSGVEIPIFVLPCAIDLDKFFKKNKNEKNKDFIFGMIAACWPHKNFDCVIEAFHREFQDELNVKLVLQARGGKEEYSQNIKRLLETINSKKITFIDYYLEEKELINLMARFDCYVLLSGGEGYSITPREALALGIPCILSDNTAHKTLCRTGFVYPVETPITQKPIHYNFFFGEQDCGDQHVCSIDAARKAMRQIYNNYDYYKKNAENSKDWLGQYNFSQLKSKYLTLMKPKKIMLGAKNQISDDCFETTSLSLYIKYQKALNL